MKILISIIVAIAMLLTGLAIGFQAGKADGFETGSEWAIIQAGLLAREAGVDMPVSLDENGFRVVIRQPRGLYQKARQRAEHYDPAQATKPKRAEVLNLAETIAADNALQEVAFRR